MQAEERMNLVERLGRMVDGLPDEAGITLAVSAIKGWLDGPIVVERDMNVSEVAKFFGKSEDTVRRWIRAGDLRAYLLGKAYRITRSAMEEFQAKARRSGR
jgi:excisionase family DNA binding protein